MRTDLPHSMLWCTAYCSEAAGADGRRAAATHLEAFLSGRLDTSKLAEWRRQQRQRGKHQQLGQGADDGDSEDEDESELDEYLQPPRMQRHWQPMLTFVTLPELPRGWAWAGHALRMTCCSQMGEAGLAALPEAVSAGSWASPSCASFPWVHPPPWSCCRVLVEVQPVACLLDETLALDSSSDSEEDEVQQAARSARRAAAAAARPPGSSMPGWIGRLQRCSSSDGGGGSGTARLWSPGRLCKVHTSVPQQAAEGPGWQQAVQGAAQELAAGLGAAELSPTDVAACKVYCLASLLNSKGGPSIASLQEAIAVALPGVQPTVVPVCAVGGCAETRDALLLELLAVRA